MHDTIYTRSRSLASGIPLGGLGTGSVELRDDGRFHDWEIFNNNLWSGNAAEEPPEMWSEDAFFALRVKEEGKAPVVRLLYDDDKRSEAVSLKHDYSRISTFPFLWNIEEITYRGQHPFARLSFSDTRVPLGVSLDAFTPFIPFNAKDSGLPLAFFTFRVVNRGTLPCEASLLFGLRNCTGYDLERMTLAHRTTRSPEAASVCMTGQDMDPLGRTFGSTVISALDPDATFMTAWTDERGLEGFRNAHMPGLGQVFIPFRDQGVLTGTATEWQRTENRSGAVDRGRTLSSLRNRIHHWRSAVCSKVTLQPGEEREVVFLMSWFYPNHYFRHLSDCRIGHMYENWFGNASDVAGYGTRHFPRLRAASQRFCDELYQGLPPSLAASLNAQLTTFPQAFWWTKNGDLSAWEGMACCQLIHAAYTPWSSFQPLLFFPDLYLEMRKRVLRFTGEEGAGGSDVLAANLRWQKQDWNKVEVQACCGAKPEAEPQEKINDLGGSKPDRYAELGYTQLQYHATARGDDGRSRPFFHGEAAGVQLLRDFQWTGDAELLREGWPMVRGLTLDTIRADKNGDGIPDGDLNGTTYDHWFLPGMNCYRATMWLAELSAAARLAEIVGDHATRETILPVLQKGRETFETLLWNGEYYNLGWDVKRDLGDRGCLADQVSGHLYMRLCGLPPNHREDRVRSALAAVFRHNRKPEEGLVNGTDPSGREDWRWFARYSARGEDEALGGQWPTSWSGTEYYVAAVMMAEGLTQEGLQVVQDAYDRHVAFGQLYNHSECGEHYFRPMSIWAVLPALQGLVFDTAEACLTFAPRITPEDFDSVFILPGVWGRLRQKRDGRQQETGLCIKEGALTLQQLRAEVSAAVQRVTATVNGKTTPTEWTQDGVRVRICFPERLKLKPSDNVQLRLE